MRSVTMGRGSSLAAALSVTACATALAVPAFGHATDKPKVSVRVEVVERTYRNELSADELRWVEDQASHAVAARLAREFGFLSFDIASAPLLLSARLVPRVQATFPETGFQVALSRATGERVGDPAGVWWTFRPAEAYGMQHIVSKEDFEREIELALDKVDYAQLMHSALAAVTISTDAELVRTTASVGSSGEITGFVGWKIPYLCRDLCIDRDSVLVVESVVPIDPIGPAQLAFRARALRRGAAPGEDPLDQPVMGEAERGQAHLDDLVRAPRKKISVQGVKMLEYRRLVEDAHCGASSSPAVVAFGDEKGSP
jgi:hypothetical protein